MNHASFWIRLAAFKERLAAASKCFYLLILPPPGEYRNMGCLLSFIGCQSETSYIN